MKLRSPTIKKEAKTKLYQSGSFIQMKTNSQQSKIGKSAISKREKSILVTEFQLMNFKRSLTSTIVVQFYQKILFVSITKKE